MLQKPQNNALERSPSLPINYDYDGSLPSRARIEPPSVIILHHTDTDTAAITRRVLKNRKLSTHFEVEKDGTIYRYLDPRTQTAFHAGSRNSQSIGIDVTHRAGAPFPAVQVEAVHRLVRSLCAEFGLQVKVAPDNVRYFEALKDNQGAYLRDDSGRRKYKYHPLPHHEYSIYRHSHCNSTRCPDGLPLAF